MLGYGINIDEAGNLFAAGISVITTGNHVWQQSSIFEYPDASNKILRPANYPNGNPGEGACIVNRRGVEIAVINLQGRRHLPAIDCPFRKAKEILRSLSRNVSAIFIDFHADDPSEKEALAHFLDGSVSALCGTHTHIQTTDEKILPNGTAYITDVGACCPQTSVIGFDAQTSVKRACEQIPYRFIAAEGPAMIHGVAISIDRETKRAKQINRIREQSSV